MPSAKVLSEKKAVVEKLASRLQSADAGVFVDYKGVNVAQDMEIRRDFMKNGVEYSVIKNTLTRFAIKKAALEEIDPILNGTTSLATTGGDPIAPFRIIGDYSKKLNGLFSVKAAFIEGKILTDDEIELITSLQSKEGLYSKVLGTMIAPVVGLAVCLGQMLEKMQGGASVPEAGEPANTEPAAEAEQPEKAASEEKAPADEKANAEEKAPAGEKANAEEKEATEEKETAAEKADEDSAPEQAAEETAGSVTE